MPVRADVEFLGCVHSHVVVRVGCVRGLPWAGGCILPSTNLWAAFSCRWRRAAREHVLARYSRGSR